MGEYVKSQEKGAKSMGNLKALTEINTKEYAHSFCLLSGVDSTNTYVRRLCDILPNGHLVVANEQHSGRGRQGKSFFSPEENGLYMSLIVKDKATVNNTLFTAKASLAVCRAIDALTGTNKTNGVGIKWVNDIYFGSKKLCGILCERLADKNGLPYVIIGIGVNLYTDISKCPRELKSICGSLFDICRKDIDAYELCAAIVKELEELLGQNTDNNDVISEYKERSVVLGHEITVIRDGQHIRAAALDICEDGALLVRYEDGFTAKLCGGEISIRVKK